ncbi:hypothetical protein [Sinomonas sp. P47F7]|uniref:hypothetical protein n=1 Tax=Sinomonas sp. P47F7 TaxID=3410987 RepID=UPI003BF46122
MAAVEGILAELRRGACPDCFADVTVAPDHDGIIHVYVAHDETCPQYRVRLNRAERRAARKRGGRS